MFIGHVALGLAAKRFAPRAPLSLLLAAPLVSDLLFPILLLLGREQMRLIPGEHGFLAMELVHMPYSHSLLASVGWAALLGLGYFAWRRDSRGALVLALLVPSHWVLDAVTHRPDVPVLISGGPRIGLGLWNSIPATLAVEGALFALCVWRYTSSTRPNGRAGAISLWSLIGLLVVMQLNTALGPPPPAVEPMAYLMLAMWLIPVWGAWIERTRSLAPSLGGASPGGTLV
jgi:membrane-bound metal-dependent hydrolase YbcI (DUF457 family)